MVQGYPHARAARYVRRAPLGGRRARRGLGDSLSDFEAELQSDPTGFGASWAQVEAQLTAEGASTALVNVAKTSFVSSYNSLTSGNGALTQGDVGAALNAAQQFVLQGGTIAGAVRNVSGLVQAVESGVPSAIVSSFTGTMIGLEAAAVAAGTITAGVGAIIVFGLELVATLFGTGGLFGQPPPGQAVGTCTVNPPPYYTVGGCYPTLAPRAVEAGPQGAKWRKFPVVGNANDAPWFGVNITRFQWTTGYAAGESWRACGTGGYRPIDTAFNEYHQLECELAWTSPANAAAQAAVMPAGTAEQQNAYMQFERTFIAAWKSNAEYAINGLARQPDYVVLLHAIHLWNASHEAGAGYEIAPVGGPYYPSPNTGVLAPTAPCTGPVPTFYAAMLVNDVLTAVSGANGTDDAITNGATLHLNTGPLKNVPIVANFNNATATSSSGANGAPAASSGASSSTAGSLATGALYVGGAALVGTAVYAFAEKKSFVGVWKNIWSATGGRIIGR